jgi:hypothetical protein
MQVVSGWGLKLQLETGKGARVEVSIPLRMQHDERVQ